MQKLLTARKPPLTDEVSLRKSADYSSAAKWPRIKLSTFKVGNLYVSLCCKVLTEQSCTDRRADLKHMLCLQKTVNMRSHEMSTEDVIFNLKSDLLQMDLQDRSDGKSEARELKRPKSKITSKMLLCQKFSRGLAGDKYWYWFEVQL